MKFSIQDFFIKCDQIRKKLGDWSHLQKKSLNKDFIFCAVKANMFHPMLSLDPGIFIILTLVLSVTFLFTSVVVYYTCLKSNCRHLVTRRNKHLLQDELELGKYIPIPSRLDGTPHNEDSNGSTKCVSRNFKCKSLSESNASSKSGYKDDILKNGFTRTPQSRVTFDFDDTIRMLRNPSGSVSYTCEVQFYFKKFSSLNSILPLYSQKTVNLPTNHLSKMLSKNLYFLCFLADYTLLINNLSFFVQSGVA